MPPAAAATRCCTRSSCSGSPRCTW
jgi:hypothetical protein